MLKIVKGTKMVCPHPLPPKKKNMERERGERERKREGEKGREYGINDREIIFVWNSSPVMKAKERLRFNVGTLVGRYSHILTSFIH